MSKFHNDQQSFDSDYNWNILNESNFPKLERDQQKHRSNKNLEKSTKTLNNSTSITKDVDSLFTKS